MARYHTLDALSEYKSKNGYSLPPKEGKKYLAFNTMPIKSEFATEKDWRIAMVYFFITTQMPTIQRQMIMQRAAMEVYTRRIEIDPGKQGAELQKLPEYARITNKLTKEITPISTTPYYEVNVTKYPFDVLSGEIMGSDFELTIQSTNIGAEARRKKQYTQYQIAQLLNQSDIGKEGLKDFGTQIPNLMPQVGDVSNYEKFKENLTEPGIVFLHEEFRKWMERAHFKDWVYSMVLPYLLTNCAIALPYIDPDTKDVCLDYVPSYNVMWDTRMRDARGSGLQFFIECRYHSFNELCRWYPELDRQALIKMTWGNNLGYLTSVAPNFQFLNGLYNIFPLSLGNSFGAPHDLNNYWASQDLQRDGAFTLRAEWKYVEDNGVERCYESFSLGALTELSGGEIANQVRDKDNYTKGKLNIIIRRHNWHIGEDAAPPVLYAEVLIKYLNMLWYKLRVAGGRWQGKIIEIFLESIPIKTGESPEEAIQRWFDHLFTQNLIVKQAAALDSMMQQLTESVRIHELGFPADIQFLWQQIVEVTRQIHQLYGFNDSRTGQVSQYATAQNAALNKSQSDFATEPVLRGLKMFLDETATHIANMLLVSARLKDAKSDLVRALDEDDFLTDTYEVQVRMRWDMERFKQKLEPMLMQMGVSGHLQLEDMFKFFMSDSLQDSIEYLKERREQQQLEAQQQQMALEAQRGINNTMNTAVAGAAKEGSIQTKADADAALQEQKANNQSAQMTQQQLFEMAQNANQQ